MKSARIIFTIAAMIFIAAGFTAPLLADGSDTVAILTTGSWTFRGTSGGHNWSYVATFKQDGTVTVEGANNADSQVLHWKMNSKYVGIFYPKYQDLLVLPLDPKGTKGLGKKNDPFVAVKVGYEVPDPNATPASATTPGQAGVYGQTIPGGTAAAPVPGISAEELAKQQQTASEIVKAYHNSLVFVTGKEGSGSGFITTISGGNFLVTNAHVAAGINGAAFKTLDGTVVQGGAASVAVGHDIFCMVMPPGGKPLEVMQGVDENASIGDYVVVLGNAEGEGVINTIIGKIVGIGPNLVEIDAPFVPGNSGSPIIHLKSGKVIGVATYTVTKTYDTTTHQKIAAPVIRRFGYRLDSVKTWQNVDWRSFYAQAAEMDSIEKLTGDLDDLCRDISQNGTITEGVHTNPVIKNRIDQWIEDKSHGLSVEDRKEVNANFLSFIKIACQTDVTAARQHIAYDYFKRELAGQQQIRDEMSKAFEEGIKSTGK